MHNLNKLILRFISQGNYKNIYVYDKQLHAIHHYEIFIFLNKY